MTVRTLRTIRGAITLPLIVRDIHMPAPITGRRMGFIRAIHIFMDARGITVVTIMAHPTLGIGTFLVAPARSVSVRCGLVGASDELECHQRRERSSQTRS